jgi:hypothetical protein
LANPYKYGNYWHVKVNGKNYLLHRLIAIAFLTNPEDKPQVNHIDGNASNYSLSNLEWVTNQENQIHSYGGAISATK